MASNRIVAVYSVEPGLDPTNLYIFEKKSLGLFMAPPLSTSPDGKYGKLC